MASAKSKKKADSKQSAKKAGRQVPAGPSATYELGPHDWEDWADHLAQRTSPLALHVLAAAKKRWPLRWSLPDDFNPSSDELLASLERLVRNKRTGNGDLATELESWLAGVDSRPADVAFALECVAWVHALPKLSETLPAAPWCQLLERLCEIAAEAAHLNSLDKPLAQQILAGELPMTLAYVLPEIKSCQAFLSEARDALSLGLNELLDGEGLPNCANLPLLRPLLACWTRCRLMSKAMSKKCFNRDARHQFDWLTLQALRTMRFDGSQVLSHGQAGSWCKELFASALELADDPRDLAASDLLLPSGTQTATSQDTPSPAAYSEWSETAVMRTEWSRTAPQLAITFSQRTIHTELNNAGESIWSGAWQTEIAIDGQPRELTSDWHELCWFSDRDVDYLEIETQLNSGWKIQRQILLARQDNFLFIGDAIIGNESAEIDYRSTLPLTASVAFQPEEETREGALVGQRRLANVLPLALPEWRAERSAGSLEQTDRGLVLAQRANQSRLYAAVFIDLDSKRFKKQLTWRQLTVAENLEIQPADVAAGYRVQVGNQQWFVYRSLAEKSSRTLLGQHLSNEFVCARFIPNGTLEELIEIE